MHDFEFPLVPEISYARSILESLHTTGMDSKSLDSASIDFCSLESIIWVKGIQNTLELLDILTKLIRFIHHCAENYLGLRRMPVLGHGKEDY